MIKDTHSSTVSFGRWRFDSVTGDVFDGSVTTRLEPQVAKLLAYFLDNQDILITREQLIESVWENRIVSDDAINRCISILRQTLSAKDRNAFIETVVRRGYISHFPPPHDYDKSDSRHVFRRRHFGWLGLAAVVLALVIYLSIQPRATISTFNLEVVQTNRPVLAVLPFVSTGNAGESGFFAEGVHDDLLTQLAQLGSIRVISRTSMLGYRGTNLNIRQIGQELGATVVLEGGVQQVGNQIRINVQLIDANTDGHLWAEQYDRELSAANIFSIQTEIAHAVASALHLALSEQDSDELKVLPTENMAAYRAYHEAMKIRNVENIGDPGYVAALRAAVELDPGFVRAWAELAGSLSYTNLPFRDPDEIQQLEAILERIRALAPDSTEYVIAQAYYTYYILRDNPRAFELVELALAKRPSDPQILELKSWIQRRLGDFEGKIDSAREAQALDPRNENRTRVLVGALIVSHRYEEAYDEAVNAAADSMGLAMLRNQLELNHHRDPQRRLAQFLVIEAEYGEQSAWSERWEAHIAARDIAGALEVLAGLGEVDPLSYESDWIRVPGVELAQAISDRFLALQSGHVPMKFDWSTGMRTILADIGTREMRPGALLTQALVNAVEGDQESTERSVRAWFREATSDLAELSTLRHYACRALGMVGSSEAAVDCVRSALAEPSMVMPFEEPYLPYYDAIRDEPSFRQLVTEIEAQSS